jgi:superfamily II DNA/RNA helicase
MTFKELGLNESIQEALSFMGFKEATPIQEKAIPLILAGKDLLASAQTGTGKTAAFILPIINKLSEYKTNGIDVLVIAPTRELAVQIEQQIQGFSYFAGISSIAVYGGGDGQDFNSQKEAITKGTDIIVATPGKLISHMNMNYTDFSHVRYLILDEADRMLDMGFYEDIQRIVKKLTKDRQTLLFSATMPPKIRTLAKSILKNFEEIRMAVSKPAEGVLQAAYLVHEHQKAPLIRKLLDERPSYTSIIIFTSTKRKVNDVVRALSGSDYKVRAVSSDLDQKDREKALRKFKSGEIRVLVATDVLSRGIDIKGINLVVNFDVPNDEEDYVHRVGRTARADSTGVALTMINSDDMYKFHRIEQLIETSVMKLPLPQEFGEGPEWNTRASSSSRYGSRNKGKGGKKSGSRPSDKRRSNKFSKS